MNRKFCLFLVLVMVFVFSLGISATNLPSFSELSVIPNLNTLRMTEPEPVGESLTFSGGSGTEDDPYLIATKDDLNNVRNNLSVCYKMIEDIEFSDNDFVVGSKYYNNGMFFLPIGDETTRFTGKFNGNGHTITGLKQNIMSSPYYGGLFGRSGGLIENLGMEDSIINVESNSSYSPYAGGIVGFNTGSVKNCYNTGDITSISTGYSNSSSGDKIYVNSYVGGIAGYNTKIIENCYNTGYVSSNTTNYGYVGGIAGYNSGGTNSASENVICNCYNIGLTHGGHYRGGILGYGGTNGSRSIRSTIEECYFWEYYNSAYGRGNVILTDVEKCTRDEMKESDTFSGFDFDNTWLMNKESPYPFPVIKGFSVAVSKENTTEFSGGYGNASNPLLISTSEQLNNIINYPDACFKLSEDILFDATEDWESVNFYGTFDGDNHTISGFNSSCGLFDINCGTILNLGLINLYITLTSDIGGTIGTIAQTNGGIIDNCYSNGTMRLTMLSLSYVGGIVGFNGGIIRNSYNNVIIDVSPQISDDYSCSYLGGVTGYNNGAIYNCYNNRKIVSKSNNSSYAGGISGINSGYGTIYNCYNDGIITSQNYYDPSSAYSYAGGITGYSSGDISNCYNKDAINAIAVSKCKSYAGGIVGYVCNSNVNNCYNLGEVKAVSYENDQSLIFMGAIVGYLDNGEISYCYYLDNMDIGVHNGTSTIEEVYTMCTDEQMKNADTFVGFDFTSTWGVDFLSDYAYPVHQWSMNIKDIDIICESNEFETVEGVFPDIDIDVYVEFKDGTYEIIDFDTSMLPDFDENKTGEQVVYIKCGSFVSASSIIINVKAKSATNINWKNKPDKQCYILNDDTLDVTNGVFTVNYDNNTTEDITLTEDMVTSHDISTVGISTFKVEYAGFELTYDVTVVSVDKIEITTIPADITYVLGQTPDFSDGEFTVTYSNDDTVVLSFSKADVTYDNTITGTIPVTVTYKGKTATFNITVAEKQVSSIAIKTKPTKQTTYKLYEDFDPAGGVLTVTYVSDDSYSEEIPLSEATFSGFDKTKAKSQYCIITYGNQTVKLLIRYNAATVEDASLVSAPTKVTYAIGDSLDTAGGKLNISYDGETYQDVTITPAMVSGFTNTGCGEQTLTITCGTFTFNYDIAIPHSIVAVDAKAATCTTSGNKACYICENCNEHFADAEGTTALVQGQWYLPALGHSWDSGTTEGGITTYTCQNDGCTATKKEIATTIAATVNDGKATVNVDADALAAAINSVKSGTVSDITIVADAGENTPTEVDVTLTNAVLTDLTNAENNTELGITIQSNVGEITLSSDVLASIKSQAGTENVTLSVARKSTDDLEDQDIKAKAAAVIEVTIKAGETNLTSFGNNELELLLPVDNTFEVGNKYDVYEISSDSSVKVLFGECVQDGENKYLKVVTKGLSDFVVTNQVISNDSSMNLSVKGDIGVNIYLDVDYILTAEEKQTAYVTCTYNHNNTGAEEDLRTDITYIKDMTAQDDGTYLFSHYVAAAQMLEAVDITLYDGDGNEKWTRSLSVKSYCYLVLKNSSKENLKKLCKAMLDYGIYAQKYFNYDADNLANNGTLYNADELAAIDKSSDLVTNLQSFEFSSDTMHSGATASFFALSHSAMRIFYSGTQVQSVSMTTVHNSTNMEVQSVAATGAEAQYIEVYNIPASELDEVFTIKTDQGTITGCGLGYAKAVITNATETTNPNLLGLSRALILYNRAADTYFNTASYMDTSN